LCCNTATQTTPYLFPFPACSAPAQPVSQPCGLPLFPLKTFDSLPPPRLFRRPHNSSRHNPANPFGTLFCQSGCCSWLPLQSDARCLATCHGTMCLSAAACWAFESGPRAQPVCRSACPAFMPACLLAALCRCSHTQCNTCCIQQHSESRRAALGATRCCWLLRLTTPGFYSFFSSDPALLHSGCPSLIQEVLQGGGKDGVKKERRKVRSPRSAAALPFHSLLLCLGSLWQGGAERPPRTACNTGCSVALPCQSSRQALPACSGEPADCKSRPVHPAQQAHPAE
jgi:hypothetical protein